MKTFEPPYKFRALVDFSDNVGGYTSYYVVGPKMTYTVEPINTALHEAVKRWLDEKKVEILN